MLIAQIRQIVAFPRTVPGRGRGGPPVCVDCGERMDASDADGGHHPDCGALGVLGLMRMYDRAQAGEEIVRLDQYWERSFRLALERVLGALTGLPNTVTGYEFHQALVDAQTLLDSWKESHRD